MITDASGQLTDQIRLQDKAAKGKSGGVVWMSKRLGLALARLKAETAKPSNTVIISQNAKAMSAQVVINWFFSVYRELGFNGCSSHSGRRTAITRWARKISSVGGSLRDVQALARHSSLAMTQKYIEVSEDACRRVVG
jgi:integrase/recombinase XerD